MDWLARKDLKSILFLCSETFPPPYAFLDKVYNRYLKEYGFETTWIMPFKEVSKVVETEWRGNALILIPKIIPQGVSDLIKLYKEHLENIKEACRMASRYYGPFSMIQVRDDPAMAYVARNFARRFNIPWAYQLSHLKEEEALAYALMGIYGSVGKNFAKFVVGFFVRNLLLISSDLVFPISPKMKKTLRYYGVVPRKMIPVPEGVDILTMSPDLFEVAARALRSRLQLRDKAVIIYVGTFGRFRQLDFLLKAFKLVSKTCPRAHLMMVGGGQMPGDEQWLKRKADEMGISMNITFTGRVPQEQVPIYVRASQVGVSPIPTNYVYANSSPIKILEYMALGIPVVGTKVPDQELVIEDSGGGLCVQWNLERFADAICKLLSLPEAERSAMGARGRAWVAKNRDYSVLSRKINFAYRGLLKGWA